MVLAASLALLAFGASAQAEEEFKVGFVYVSPVGDAGYSFAHDQGRKEVEKMDGVTTSYVESVPEGADAERVILNMARKGFDLIFTTSFGYMDPTLKVAKQFPDVTFMHCSGYKTHENMGNYFGRIYQSRYLTGIVAGEMTEDNVLGYVAAYPIPEVIRGINAFTLGAQSVNPDVEVRVVWTKTWYDPATEKEAAKSLLDVGADVIAMHQDSPGPMEAAQEAGAYGIAYNSDMSAFAPKAHLTSAVWNWGVLYTDVVKDVMNGSWESEALWWGIETGIVGLAPYGPMVPDEVREDVSAKKQALVDGDFEVFAGPIKNRQGEVKVPEGESMTDQEMLGMTWFVQGVVGTTE
jgi:basic membrane protein A